jgi:uncharacterized membrane protein (UPF0127 family)/CheY-like chemotaxis protein
VATTKLIVNLTRDECVCVCEIADRPLGRMRGLLGRSGLPAGEGLLLSPAPAIHTAFMRFPIDALFLDANMRVLDIVERLRPWRFASTRRARAVLELSAGECARRAVEVGDRLELRERCVNGAARPAAPDGADRGIPRSDMTPVSASDIVRARRGQDVELTRLQPLRVLIVSSDHQFRTVMSLLLTRRNCSVTTTANAARVAELIAREGTDVVVIDDDQPSAAKTIATVTAPARPVGVVVIADDTPPATTGLRTLPKWGPFEDLLAAVERADERRGTWGGSGVRG